MVVNLKLKCYKTFEVFFMIKNKKMILETIKFLLSLVFSIGIFILGFVLGKQCDFSIVYYYIGVLVVFFGYLIFCLAYHAKYEKEIQNMKSKNFINNIEEQKKYINSNISETKNKILKMYSFCICNIFVSYFIYYFCLFFTGLVYPTIINNDNIAPLAAFTDVVFVIIFLIILIPYFNSLKANKITLSYQKNQYKILTTFIAEIFKSEDINKSFIVNININDSNCAIEEKNDKLFFYVGDLLLKFLTLDELKSVFYHELAHYKHKDTKYLSKINKKQTFVEKYSFLFICPCALKVSVEIELSKIISSKYYEQKADDEVLDKNLNKEFSQANVKLFGLSLISSAPNFEIINKINEEKGFSEETISLNYKLIYENYMKNISTFDYISTHHLEERISTHPNVRMRREKFHLNNIDINLIENNYFNDDIKLAYINFNKDNKSNFNPNFCETYKLYKENICNLDNISNNSELVKLLNDALSYNDFNNGLKIANILIKTDEDNSFINYALGYAYFNLLDEKCIKYLQKVIDANNSNYKMQALSLLGQYYVYMGNEEKRDELRKIQPDFIDENIILSKVSSLEKYDKLIVLEDKEIIDKIINIVKDKEEIIEVRAGIKRIKSNQCIHIIYILKKKPNNIGDIYEYINSNAYLMDSEINNMLSIKKTLLNYYPCLKKKKYIIYSRTKN